MLLKTKCVVLLAGSILALAGLHVKGDGCPGQRLLALVGVSSPSSHSSLCCAVAAAAEPTTPAVADEKKDKKDKPAPSGAWVRKEGELKLDFADKDVLKISPHGDNAVLVILCESSVDKDGRVKVKVTGYEGKAEAVAKVKNHLPEGTAFSFAWTVKDDAAKLDDLKGQGDHVEHLKMHLEGDYERKK